MIATAPAGPEKQSGWVQTLIVGSFVGRFPAVFIFAYSR